MGDSFIANPGRTVSEKHIGKLVIGNARSQNFPGYLNDFKKLVLDAQPAKLGTVADRLAE
ncbi:hypothetical protein ACODNH_07455 [Haloarcula sp. NS06]|uniref:hypothetical protein n=1 Tax=unclassified Haloarcula TaxID=2624677 RepID=UPI0027B2D7AC|nr:hypothetical protein [Haloarcula sp. H-GB4]MDQ2073253.1 hypothetical protein [Haloarcula sp. H-GB4]